MKRELTFLLLIAMAAACKTSSKQSTAELDSVQPEVCKIGNLWCQYGGDSDKSKMRCDPPTETVGVACHAWHTADDQIGFRVVGHLVFDRGSWILD